jgi:hypothetical protein
VKQAKVNPLQRRREIAWPTLSTAWDEEGGAPAVAWPLPYKSGDLLDAERRVLECLGAALVIEWNDLPTDVPAQALRARGVGKIT